MHREPIDLRSTHATMKPHDIKTRAERAVAASRTGSDDNLGRGMELALTIGLFLVLGLLLDHWLGTSPVFTIVLLLLAAIGSFTRMRYTYEASMQRHEAERRERMRAARPSAIDEVA